MSQLHYHAQPTLRDPLVIAAFRGWNDAAESATHAIQYLADRWSSEKIAEIDSEDFFIFTETRPTVKITDDDKRVIVWPNNEFLAYSAPDLERDIILFLGTEPQLKWNTFAQSFLKVCRNFRASEVILFGSMLSDVPHSLAVPITGASYDPATLSRLEEMTLPTSGYEGPTGILSVLHEVCHQAQIPTTMFWAAAPHYLATTPNIMVSSALLTTLNGYLSLDLDLDEIQAEARRFSSRIDAMVARNPEAGEYIRQLEEQLDELENEIEIEIELEEEDEDETDSHREEQSTPLPSADVLIENIEAMLRMEREHQGLPYHSDDDEKDVE
ncbi:PAC2 family protein [Ktedonobacter robiniae]|uniref:PAC2 family protein n=1 Tax=Ktedonobacter robiniae TaxID=2778365 RepID=A0ABQ3V509_9CHLR|nr:PAC2 family protein [Ktedonobacter robiniae]GHO60261.1 hypothetical protein KSB_87360 [Ktedonobacter robiniae]